MSGWAGELMATRPVSSKRRRRPPPEGGLEVFVADEQSAHPVDVAALVAAGRAGARGAGRARRRRAVGAVRRRRGDDRAPQALHGRGRPHRRPRPSRSTTTWSSSAAGPTRAPPVPTAARSNRTTRRCCWVTWSSARRWRPATRPTHAGSYEDELALARRPRRPARARHGPRGRVDDRRHAGPRARAADRVPRPARTRPLGRRPVVNVVLAVTVETVDVAMIIAIVVLLGAGRLPGAGRDRAHPHEPGQGARRSRSRAGAARSALVRLVDAPRGVHQPAAAGRADHPDGADRARPRSSPSGSSAAPAWRSACSSTSCSSSCSSRPRRRPGRCSTPTSPRWPPPRPVARAHPLLAAAHDLARPHRAHQRDPPGQGPEAGPVRVRGGAARGGRRGRTSRRRSTTTSARSSGRSSSSATRSSAR